MKNYNNRTDKTSNFRLFSFTIITSALIFVAGLAWRDVFSMGFSLLFDKKDSMIGTTIYATALTIFMFVLIALYSKFVLTPDEVNSYS
jgi:hypothetical protein